MKFSILLPTYKSQFLHECIESIITQTYKDLEIIIVNDASPEDIYSIVSQFSDNRIHYYVNEKNCGAENVVDNWNICLGYSSGDYVLCIGDDDRLLPTCLEEFYRLINTNPGLGVYHAWTEIIDENSQVVRMQEARPLRECVYAMIWERWQGRIQYIGDFLYERKSLLRNGGFYKLPLAWGADDITAYIAAEKTGIANMQIPGFQYRINSQTISRTSNPHVKLGVIRLEELWYAEFLKKEPNKNDTIVYTYWRMVNNRLYRAMIKKRIHIISEDMCVNGFLCIFHYITHRKLYSINMKMIAYAFVEAVKKKNI